MRESTDITISRFTNNGWAVSVGIIGVPITPASRRKYHLMTEDSITLNFSLEQPIEFKVGDFIIDEIFGLFILREKQFPTYNKNTGGYDYQLRFDNAYWLWNNHINMLTAPLDGATPIAWTESEGTTILNTTGVQRVGTNYPYKRQEAVWCLTNSLAYHVEQVLCNILAADLTYYGRPYNARILPTATKAKEIRFINYDAKRICDSLTEIANEFECEWWVTYEGTPAVGWINFGKCELGNTAKEFTLGDNVETMQASRDLTNYANRIYVFGGTKNVPESYRKKLLLHIDTQKTIGGVTCFLDSDRKVDPYTMLQDEGTQVEQMEFQLSAIKASNYVAWASTIGDDEVMEDVTGGKSTIKYRSVAHKVGDTDIKTFGFSKDTEVTYSTFSAGLRFSVSAGQAANMRMELRLFFEEYSSPYTEGDAPVSLIYLSPNPYIVNYSFSAPYSATEEDYIADFFVQGGKKKLTGGKVYKLVLECVGAFDTDVGWIYGADRDYIGVTDRNDFCKVILPAGKSFDASVIWGNTTYPITFNPSGFIQGEDDSYYFCFPNGIPSGFDTGIIVELLEYRPDMVETAWYTDDTDDPSSLIGLGDRRLRLPFYDPDSDPQVPTNGYVEIEREPSILEVQRTEMAIKNDNIYPKCYLRVTEVRTEQKEDKMVYADGTEYTWPWLAYIFKAEIINGDPFPFQRKFVKDGEKLRALFLSDYDEQKAYDEMGLNWNTDNNHEKEGGDIEIIETDITPTQWETASQNDGWRKSRYWNSSGTLTSASGSAYATRIDVSRYQGCTLHVYVYTGASTSNPRCMFKDADDEIIDGTVERIRCTGGNYVERTVPDNAAYFCVSNNINNLSNPYVIAFQEVAQDATIEGFLLAGMEFDVGFSTYNGNEYTLIRNEEYGAKLPSSRLMPKVGDTFVLTGWNVESIESLGLVRIAEEQLWYFSLDYLEAMQEDGWTFRCGMMTDTDEPLYQVGTKVRVYHDSLAGGFKDSRIIGYELKLDIPEDSPVYEVGETDAYSRIKQLEKQVEQL